VAICQLDSHSRNVRNLGPVQPQKWAPLICVVSTNVPTAGWVEARGKPMVLEIPDSEDEDENSDATVSTGRVPATIKPNIVPDSKEDEHEDEDSDATVDENWKSIGAAVLRATRSPSSLTLGPKLTAKRKTSTAKKGNKSKSYTFQYRQIAAVEKYFSLKSNNGCRRFVGLSSHTWRSYGMDEVLGNLLL